MRSVAQRDGQAQHHATSEKRERKEKKKKAQHASSIEFFFGLGTWQKCPGRETKVGGYRYI